MQQVIHPDTGKLTTVEQYIALYPNSLLDNINYQPPLMICPHCSNPNMTLRGRSSVSISPHFVHPQNSGYCPSQENKEGIYRGHLNQEPDLDNAKVLKNHFRHNWQYYFEKVKTLIPYLRKEEFTKLLDIANSERIWEYRNVEPYHIPYLLVTLADFPVQIPDVYHKLEYCRKLHFRYWFNSELNNYEAIVNNLNRLSLCRASYKLKGKERLPTPERLMKIMNIRIDNDLMEQDITHIPKFIEQWVNKYFEIKEWKA